MAQTFGVNRRTGVFAGASGGDGYPIAVRTTLKMQRGKWKTGRNYPITGNGEYNTGDLHVHWGNGAGGQAARFGQIVEETCQTGFVLAWSSRGGSKKEGP